MVKGWWQVVDEGKDKWRAEAAQWTEHTAEEGTYYYNTASGESTWECPPAVAFQQEITRSGFAMYASQPPPHRAVAAHAHNHHTHHRTHDTTHDTHTMHTTHTAHTRIAGKRSMARPGSACTQPTETSTTTTPRYAPMLSHREL
jgi:hypothetical protein